MRTCRGVLCFLLAVSAPAGAELRFGRAAVKITPTAETGGVRQVLDDLYVKAAVFEGNGTVAAMAACDLPVINRPVVEAARRRIEAATGIPAGNVMISATHTHTGLVPGWAGGSWPSLEAAKTGREAGEAGRYTAFLTESIAAAVAAAYKDRRPARVAAVTGREESLPFNRRFLMRDGTVRFNPGIRNPDIVRPVGPVDGDVNIAYFEAAGGEPLAALVNYAMHLDTIGRDAYSADYAGALAKLLAEAKGPGMLTLFTIGTAGNINHLDVTRPSFAQGYGEAARIGTILAGAVLKAWPGLKALDVEAVRVTRETVPLPPVDLAPGDVERAHGLAAREAAGGKPLTLLERVFTQRVLFAERQQGRPLDVEVLAVALGRDLAWVALPGEVFVELGMAIKRGSPFRYTIVNELAWDWIRYVPNRKGFAEGHYEATNTRCGPGGGEALADAALRCLLRLHGQR